MANSLTLHARSALALPLLAALALSNLGCAADREEEQQGPAIKNVRQLVYAVRQTTYQNAEGQWQVDVAGGMGQVIDYTRYVPGGRLELLDLATGDTKNLVPGFPKADISSLDVNFDGTRVVFSMKKDENDSYHIYWVALQSENDVFELHQLTFGEWDDVYPTYIAGDRIAFVTNQAYTAMGTRADEYNHSRAVSQIATITLQGGDADRKLCSQNLSHTVNLFAMKDGRIGYSRWEHLENVNDAKLFAMNPDCTQMIALSGQHGKSWNSIVQASETNTQNVFIGIATTRNRTIHAGSIVKMDMRNPNDPALFYEEEPKYEFLTDAVPVENTPSAVGRYRLPTVLPDGRVLASWAPGFVNDLNELAMTPPDFGIYVYDPDTRMNQLVKNYEGTWEVYARPVIEREEPPLIGSIQDTSDPTLPTVFGSVDIKQTSLGVVHDNTVSGAQFPEGTPIEEALAHSKKVRIIEGFSSEAATGVTMFGLTMAEGAAILGEADVYADGSWMAALPPYIPVHLQPIDEFELAIRSQTTWIQGMPGEDRVCGGCHESRKDPVLPGGQGLTTAAAKGPQNFNLSIDKRQEYPWYSADAPYAANEIQKILDAKCAQCHNDSTTEYYTVNMTNNLTGETTPYQIPRLDLTNKPITITYDNKTATYPVSYVSMFYPAAMKVTTMDLEIVGTVPPKWAVPSDARNSALIEKINMPSSKDSNKTAWALGQPFSDPGIKGGTRTLHPEDKGVELTRDERRALIRAIDMGGQYYARQNTQFQQYAADPLGAPGGQQY